jgi:hypothetical protein
MERMDELFDGVVVNFHQQGYGFLFSGGKINRRIFFHICDWNRATDPVVGDGCTFQLAPSPKPGKPDIAVNITPTGVNAYAVASKAVSE